MQLLISAAIIFIITALLAQSRPVGDELVRATDETAGASLEQQLSTEVRKHTRQTKEGRD